MKVKLDEADVEEIRLALAGRMVTWGTLARMAKKKRERANFLAAKLATEKVLIKLEKKLA